MHSQVMLCEDSTPGGAALPATAEPAVPCGSLAMCPVAWRLSRPRDESAAPALEASPAGAERASIDCTGASPDRAAAVWDGAGAGARLSASSGVLGAVEGAELPSLMGTTCGSAAAAMSAAGARVRSSASSDATAAGDGANAAWPGAGAGASVGAARLRPEAAPRARSAKVSMRTRAGAGAPSGDMSYSSELTAVTGTSISSGSAKPKVCDSCSHPSFIGSAGADCPHNAPETDNPQMKGLKPEDTEAHCKCNGKCTLQRVYQRAGMQEEAVCE